MKICSWDRVNHAPSCCIQPFQTSKFEFANHDIFTSWWHNHLCFNQGWPWPWRWFRSETTVNDSRSSLNKFWSQKDLKMKQRNEFLFLVNVTKFITSYWLVFESESHGPCVMGQRGRKPSMEWTSTFPYSGILRWNGSLFARVYIDDNNI